MPALAQGREVKKLTLTDDEVSQVLAAQDQQIKLLRPVSNDEISEACEYMAVGDEQDVGLAHGRMEDAPDHVPNEFIVYCPDEPDEGGIEVGSSPFEDQADMLGSVDVGIDTSVFLFFATSEDGKKQFSMSYRHKDVGLEKINGVWYWVLFTKVINHEQGGGV